MVLMEEQTTTKGQKIDFPSKVENIALVEKLVDTVCESLRINEDYYGNILIALTEAVNNAIQHGNNHDPAKHITVAYINKPEQICFTVADEGGGFNFENLPDPTDPENIEKPHGRGVFLMRNLADEVVFHQNGSIVELNFRVN